MQRAAEDTHLPVSRDPGALVQTVADLRSSIRSYQEEIERERRIPKPLVQQLRAAGLYRMMVPQELGGEQADPLTYLRVVELASEGDGSAGWNLANNGICQISALSLPDAGAREVFDSGPDTICAGTLVPGGGRGTPVDGGYIVTGRWRFGSGCQEADWMVANFQIFDGDQPRQNSDGTPALWRVFFPASDCSIIDTWDMTGQRGTGSHDWSVSEVFVPERRTVRVDVPMTNQWNRWPGTLYALPIHAIIGPHHSAVATGIACAGIDALAELAGSKVPRARTGLLREQAQVQDWLGRAKAILEAGQAYRTAVVADIWQTVEAGRPSTLEQRARCRLAASHAVDCALQAMDLMFRAGGTTSTERGQRLARCWRDVRVVGQSAGVMPEWYALGGRVFLGMEPNPRLS